MPWEKWRYWKKSHENSQAGHIKNYPRTHSYFSFPHPVPNLMHCMCNVYLSTCLLSIQEIHQRPQDVICILCNCVSGISGNISCPFHLAEYIRHLLDTFINTSLKAGQVREAKTRLSVAQLSAILHKLKTLQIHKLRTQLHTLPPSSFLLTYCICYQDSCYPVPYTHHPQTAYHLWTRHTSHLRSICSWRLQKETILSRFWEMPLFLAKAALMYFCFLYRVLHHKDWDIVWSNGPARTQFWAPSSQLATIWLWPTINQVLKIIETVWKQELTETSHLPYSPCYTEMSNTDAGLSCAMSTLCSLTCKWHASH